MDPIQYINLSREDEDFVNIRNIPEFKRLIKLTNSNNT